jgi:succinate-semialdehyde dehydrogenase/glutarate-semialdehyde dehydrogenase
MATTPIHESPLLAQLSGYLSGAFLPATGASLIVNDPATGLKIASLPSFGERETRDAISASERALILPTSLAKRKEWLERIADAHVRHRETLAQIITKENGKPISEARGEVDYSATFYADCARRINCLAPRVLQLQSKNHQWTVYARPAGVAGLIVPWNFPLAMLAKKAAAALAAGCPIVVKPSEKTPLSSIALFHIFHEAGVPPGMAHLVFGDAQAIGKALCQHPAVRVISFTGSTAVGKLLSVQAAPHVKRMALELGGNAPFIVFEDADLGHAASELMTNKFRCSGQTCVCTNRVYVHSKIASAFGKLLASKVSALKVGPGADPSTQVGPLIDREGFDKVQDLVADALQSGASALAGGPTKIAAGDTGRFYPPTVLADVKSEARCLKEELFGPVILLVRFDNDEEVIHAANDTEYGLAAYVFTQSAERADSVITQLRFGHVGLNTGTGPTAEAPFGGMKQSGLGREGGDEGIFEFIELQTVPASLAL